jgi:cytochrome P450
MADVSSPFLDQSNLAYFRQSNTGGTVVAQGEPENMSDVNSRYDLVFDPGHWGRYGAPHDVLDELRRDHPVYWYESDRYDPAWVLTRYKDVEAVGRDAKRFLSGPRTVFHNPKNFQSPLIGLPQLDAPQHTKHKRAMQSWFTPRAIMALENRIEEIAKEIVDGMTIADGCEFCNVVGAQLPLKVICEFLGIPEEQESVVWQLTQDVFAVNDPDMTRAKDAQLGVRNAMAFCAEVGQSRRETPTDDFASTIANAEIDGEAMTIQEIASHLMIMISAGHDTTASAINGGMLALIRNPDQLAMLRANPELMDSAVNEMLRFVTPTTNFVRTAVEDAEVGGVKINAGDDLCIHFAAANRDSDVFDDPHAFRIDRKPNRHLAFGGGPHACIGQLLAKLEMKCLFAELIPRLEQVSLDREPDYIQAFWVTGLKRLPIHYVIGNAS